MATLHHWGATAHPIFKIRISRNIKCDSLVGFPKSGHILTTEAVLLWPTAYLNAFYCD